MKTYAVILLLGIWRKNMLNTPHKIMTYLRTKPSKITRCQRPIIHAIKIFYMVQYLCCLIGGQGHTLK